MKYNLNNQQEQKQAREYFEKLLSQHSIIEIKKKNPTRSLHQNSYLHLLLSYCALESGLSLEEFKFSIFKVIINRDLFLSKDNNEKMDIEFTKVKSSADLTTLEMSIAVDRLKKFAAEKMDLYLPDAEDSASLRYMENKIEANSRYL